MTSTGRGAIVLGTAAILLAGCAQPGQLGAAPPAAPAPATATVTVTAEPTPAEPTLAEPTPAEPPAGPVLLGSGRLDVPVTLRTPGPAVVSVHTETLPPGGSTGWHRRPGTELSIVKSGSVTLVQAERCTTTRYAAGEALLVLDAQAHLLRNDGPVPAEVVTTVLLAPGVPDREDLPPRC